MPLNGRRPHCLIPEMMFMIIILMMIINTRIFLGKQRKAIENDIVTCISVAREQLGKHVPAKTNTWPTIGKVFLLLGNEIVNTQQ
jgi:hypothetical protein